MTRLTAVVTGGSVGIGAAIAHALLEAGHSVITLSREAPEFTSDRLTAVEADLSDPAATAAAAKAIAVDHEVNALVNNAGQIRPAPVEDVTDDDLDYLVNLHMRAAITLTQAFLPAMKQAKFGRIVNMSSRAIVGLAGRTVYAGTKAALIAMTNTWAVELGPHGITVNAIAPGPIVTDMLTSVIPEDSEKARALAASLPVRRLGTPDDVARAAMFFLDPEAGFVTGQTLYVCGGASLGMKLL